LGEPDGARGRSRGICVSLGFRELWAKRNAGDEIDGATELPGALPQPWIVKDPATPAETVEKAKIKSELLKNERDLSVYTPPDYKAQDDPYALLMVFDEGAYLNQVPTPLILDNLIAASKIPAAVAVLIANPTQETRNKELPPNPDFADFLAKELLPWMHAHYNVTSDPRLTVVAGFSYGGVAATYAGCATRGFSGMCCPSPARSGGRRTTPSTTVRRPRPAG
jgi:enterochelin esterase-like enzyme